MSFSYRFAPQASIADIISDANDAYGWCRAHLRTFLGSTVDLDSYAVGGDSAGGTIAGLLAQTLSPPPKAFLANHPLLDLADPYFNTIGDEAPLSGEFTEAEVEAAARDNDPANAIITSPSPGRVVFGEDKLRRAFHSLTLVVGRRQRLQGDVFTLLNRGNWVNAVLRGASEEERSAYAEQWSPLRLIGARGGAGTNGTASIEPNGNGAPEGVLRTNGDAPGSNPPPSGTPYPHPPTFFIHGEDDLIVPIAQSHDMAVKLRSLGVPVMEYYEPGAGHVFDQRFTVSSDMVRAVRAELVRQGRP